MSIRATDDTEAGWHLDRSFLDPARNRHASRAARDGDTTALRAIVDEIVDP